MLNRHKLFISIIVLFSFILCGFCGCNTLRTISKKLDHTKKMEEAVQTCFNNNDAEGLYDLFSEESREKPYLVNRLKTLCYLWNSVVKDGSGVEFRHDAGGGKEYRDGEIVYDSQTFDIVSHEGTNIEYIFRVYDYRVYKEAPRKEGVYAISLISGNTLIYGTDYKGEKVPEELIYPPMYCERQAKILDDIFLLIGNEEYIQSEDSERVIYVQNQLETIIKKDYEENGDYMIDISSVKDTTSNDGNGEYPAIQFQFVDGSAFVVIVHNNPYDSNRGSITDKIYNNFVSYEKQKGVSETILSSIVEKDSDKLYDMFSPYQKQTVDIDEQIESLFEFCDLSQFEVANAEYNTVIGEQSVRDGRIVYMTLSDIIENIYDNEGKKFTVSYYSILTNEEDPSKEGLVSITVIRDEDNERISVG